MRFEFFPEEPRPPIYRRASFAAVLFLTGFTAMNLPDALLVSAPPASPSTVIASSPRPWCVVAGRLIDCHLAFSIQRRSMCGAFLPFVQIGLFCPGSLLLLRIAFPRLVGLRVRSLIIRLSGIIFDRFFAHHPPPSQKRPRSMPSCRREVPNVGGQAASTGNPAQRNAYSSTDCSIAWGIFATDINERATWFNN
jgi:hypothetical protein